MDNLGVLENVDIREIWKREDTGFTKWLSEEQNLTLLSHEIGIPLRLHKVEASVGKYYADIVAEVENTEQTEYVIIENQLELTDHDHLGKLITYGSGYNAKILIWIFKEIDDEHRQAIDWLNENSELNIFALKIEAWRIGDSKPAPKLQIICSPNNWAKLVKKSSEESRVTNTNLMQLDFWNNFNRYLREHKNNFNPRKALPQNWYDLSVGKTQINLRLVISYQNNNIRCDIIITEDKTMFKKMFDKKDIIEKELGFNPEWNELPDNKSSIIRYFNNNDVDLNNKDNYENYFRWLLDVAEKYLAIIKKYC
jgi:hypothetical protein